ncbi:hypothetical protein GGI21_006139, partial [Coemansia aciculifera]
MRVSLAIALTVAAAFVAAHPLNMHMKGPALRKQSSLQARDEGPPSGNSSNNDPRAMQAAPANAPGSPPSSDHQPAKGPEPEHGSGENRVDPPQRMRDEPQSQHGSDNGQADAREQSRPQVQPQPQPQPPSQSRDDHNEVRDHGNSNTNSGGSSHQENSHPQDNSSNGNAHDNRSGEGNSGPRPDNNNGSRPENNGRPVHEHFEQVEHPGGNPGNVDRLTHDVVNDDRNGIHSNVVQRVS